MRRDLWATTALQSCVGCGSYAVLKNLPLAARCEPSALKGWFLEVLYIDLIEGRTFLRIGISPFNRLRPHLRSCNV